MQFEKFVGLIPVFLIPLAWATTLFNNLGIVGATSIKVMHTVMVIFLPIFLYFGNERLKTGVLKVWRNVIFAGVIFTISGSAGLFLDLDPLLTFFPELVYWALIPSFATVYTSWKDEWNRKLLFAGIIGILGGLLFAFSLYTGLLEIWVGIVLLGIGQKYSIIQAVKMDKG